MNNDILAARPGWLSALAEQALRPAVGVVGAKLLYPDGRVQHAGAVVGLCGWADHIWRRLPRRGRRVRQQPFGQRRAQRFGRDRRLFDVREEKVRSARRL